MSAGQLLDSHGFEAFIKSLSQMSGKAYLPVLIDQAGSVLDLCIARSPDPYRKLGRAKVRRSVELRIEKPLRYIGENGTVVDQTNRVPRPIPYSTLQTLTGTRGGVKGGEWYVGQNRKGKRIFLAPDKMIGNEKFHLRQGIKFGLYEATRPKVQQAIEAVGSVKASWVAIADMIGAPLRKAPQWVKKVRSLINDGQKSRVEVGDAATFVELVNTNVMLINRYNGASILQGAIDTRLKAFAIQMEKGLFDDIARRAKVFPGIFTN